MITRTGPTPDPNVPYARWSFAGREATGRGVVEGGAVRAYPPGAPGGRGVDPRAGAPPRRAPARGPPGPGVRGAAAAQAREPRTQPAIGAHAATIRALADRGPGGAAQAAPHGAPDLGAPRRRAGRDLSPRATVRRYVRECRRELAPRPRGRRDRRPPPPGRGGPGRLRPRRTCSSQGCAPRWRCSSCACPTRAPRSTSPSAPRARRRSSRATSPRSRRLGGVPARIRYDNARALVARVLRGRNRIETERFIALRSHYGFDSFFCIPGERGAHEKGGIEGEVGRQRRRFFVPDPAGQEPRRAQPAARGRPTGADLARHIGQPPRRRSARWARPTGRRSGRCPPSPSTSPGSPRSGSTARPGCASASASTRCPRGSPAGR